VTPLRSLARRLIATWDEVRDRPVGRLLRRVRDGVDPVVYGSWLVVTWLRTRRPATFNDKVKAKMLYDRRPGLSILADKVAVRDVIAERVGAAHLTTLYQVRERPEAIRWSELPREFVCKVNHASGGTIIVSDDPSAEDALPSWLAPGHGRLVVHPEGFDPARASEILGVWLDRPYGWSGWKREWAYRAVRPRVLVEEYLRGPDGSIPDDVKVFVFDGRCRVVQIDRDRHGDHRRDMMTPDWERLPVDFNHPRSDVPPERPERLDEMLRLAERLAEGHDFLRVDLFSLADRIVVGELTLYPASGDGTFEPRAYDRWLGSWWTLPDSYDAPELASSSA
jgi:hypothetical protein